MNLTYSKVLNVVLIAIIMFMMRYCSDCSETDLGRTSTVTTIDTIRSKTHIDTIPFYDTVPRYIEVSIYKEKVDTGSIGGNATFQYNNIVSDSLIDGIISTTVTDEGQMLSQEFIYNPLFPKYIKQTDTLFINTNTTVTKYPKAKMSIMYGLQAEGNATSFGFKGLVGLKTKKGTNIFYSYDVVNNRHGVGVLLPLTLNRNSVRTP